MTTPPPGTGVRCHNESCLWRGRCDHATDVAILTIERDTTAAMLRAITIEADRRITAAAKELAALRRQVALSYPYDPPQHTPTDACPK